MSVVFAIERMRDIVDELKPLHRAHWDELLHLRPSGEFNPDYERYFRLEDQGATVLAIARRDGRVIGYCQWYINRDLWTSRPYASGDLIYVVPQERGGWIAPRLFKYSQDALEHAGVKEFRTFVRAQNRIGKLIRYMGYQPTGGQQYVRAT